MSAKISDIKPLSDYILVEPLQKETTLPSGIVIPDTVKEKPQEGRILAVGPGSRDKDGRRIEMEVKIGDVIMYKKWGDTEIKIEGKELILLKEEDVLAVIEKNLGDMTRDVIEKRDNKRNEFTELMEGQ